MVGSGCGRVSMPMAMVPTSKCVPVPAVNAAVGAIDATCSMYTEHSGTAVLPASSLSMVWGMVVGFRLQQTQFAGTGYRFGAPLDLELAKDFQVVPFHRTQGEEQPLAHLTIREALGYEVEYF